MDSIILSVDHFFEDYFHIMSDPAHLAAEISLMIVIDLIGLGIVIPFIHKSLKKSLNKSISREHARLDEEHGIEHHDDHIHRVDPPAANC